VLASPLTTCGTYHRDLLPRHASLRHRRRGETARHASKREPTRKACVTTAVVASPGTMRANGPKAPRFSRPLTTRYLCLSSTATGAARPVTFRCPRSPIAYMLATSSFVGIRGNVEIMARVPDRCAVCLQASTAHTILAAIGLHMEKCPNAKAFCAWRGLAPRHEILGGKG